MNIDVAKYKLIQFITEVQSEFVIKKLLSFINQFRNKPELETEDNELSAEQERLLALGSKPTPESISFEELKKEQGYSIEKLRQGHAQIDHSLWADENLDELLAML